MNDVAAAAADPSFLKHTSHDMRSAQGKTYRIIVAPPPGPAKAGGYPAIYVMDGNAWTPRVAEVVRANRLYSVISRTEPAVVVGIGYPTELPFDGVRRLDRQHPGNLWTRTRARMKGDAASAFARG